MRKRTDAIEKHVDHARTPQGQAKSGVFVVPKMLSIDEWEAIGIPQQEQLMREVRH